MNSGAIMREGKKKSLKVCGLVGKYSKDYAMETSLNCLKYVGNDKLSTPSRAYFAVLFVIVVGIAVNFASNVYVKWNNTPVIVTKASHKTPISTDPFPAITICNMNMAMKRSAKNIKEGTLEYAMLQNACFRKLNYTAYGHLQNNHSVDYKDFLVKVAQPCKEMIVNCKYGGEEVVCSSLFREILLDDGICCVFNIEHPQFLYNRTHSFINDYASVNGRIPVDWNPESGYPKELPQHFYPRKGVGAGKTKGMSVLLNADIDQYFCSSANGQGFKVMLHNPIDTPNIKETGLAIRIGYETTFRIMTNSFSALPSIRSIGALRRYCFFQDELKLHYYKYYSRRNCEHECDGDYIARHCNCLPHYLGSMYMNVSLCRVRDFDCLNKATKRFSDDISLECKVKCLPSCHNTFYYPAPFFASLAKQDYIIPNGVVRNTSKEYALKNYALLHIYYKDDWYMKNIRTPYTATTDYLSQTGAILSLMVGFGVLSLAEFFYFWFIRPVFDYRLKRPPFAQTKTAVGIKKVKPRTSETSREIFFLKTGRHFRRPPIHTFSYQDYLDNYGYLE